MEKKIDRQIFKEKLESSGEFPMNYLFKFIVKTGKEQEVQDIFPSQELILKSSSGGKYTSVTIEILVENAEHVIEIYEKAAQIEGLISL
jgi:putative lipoic acid-binding regulatory protein